MTSLFHTHVHLIALETSYFRFSVRSRSEGFQTVRINKKMTAQIMNFSEKYTHVQTNLCWFRFIVLVRQIFKQNLLHCVWRNQNSEHSYSFSYRICADYTMKVFRIHLNNSNKPHVYTFYFILLKYRKVCLERILFE